MGWNPRASADEQWKLGRTRALLDLDGAPDRRLTCVLVAGTKGKGSTAAWLASVLDADGRRVGLYTQPHLQSYRERIRLGGLAVSRRRAGCWRRSPASAGPDAAQPLSRGRRTDHVRADDGARPRPLRAPWGAGGGPGGGARWPARRHERGRASGERYCLDQSRPRGDSGWDAGRDRLGESRHPARGPARLSCPTTARRASGPRSPLPRRSAHAA